MTCSGKGQVAIKSTKGNMFFISRVKPKTCTRGCSCERTLMASGAESPMSFMSCLIPMISAARFSQLHNSTTRERFPAIFAIKLICTEQKKLYTVNVMLITVLKNQIKSQTFSDWKSKCRDAKLPPSLPTWGARGWCLYGSECRCILFVLLISWDRGVRCCGFGRTAMGRALSIPALEAPLLGQWSVLGCMMFFQYRYCDSTHETPFLPAMHWSCLSLTLFLFPLSSSRLAVLQSLQRWRGQLLQQSSQLCW